MLAVRLRITGMVQGVFFRSTTKEVADMLGVTGWMRNEPDGSVLVHAEGTPKQVEKLEEWCGRGPPAARVDSVERTAADEEGHVEFSIVQ